MRFNSHYDFVPVKQELYDDKEIVETAGYVPRQKTIENLIACGQKFYHLLARNRQLLL